MIFWQGIAYINCYRQVAIRATRGYPPLAAPTASTLSTDATAFSLDGLVCSKERMEAELKYPAWQVPLQEAILDFRNKRKLLQMETTIVQRLYALTGSGRFDEQQALPIGTANARRGQLLL